MTKEDVAAAVRTWCTAWHTRDMRGRRHAYGHQVWKRTRASAGWVKRQSPSM
jgi:hypothetical protein